MVTRVYMKRGGETVLKNFRKEESARKYFGEQEGACGANTRMTDCSTNIKLSTGVCVKRRAWENGDSIELISYDYGLK